MKIIIAILALCLPLFGQITCSQAPYITGMYPSGAMVDFGECTISNPQQLNSMGTFVPLPTVPQNATLNYFTDAPAMLADFTLRLCGDAHGARCAAFPVVSEWSVPNPADPPLSWQMPVYGAPANYDGAGFITATFTLIDGSPCYQAGACSFYLWFTIQ